MVGFVAIPTATAEEVTNTASMALTCTATPITSLAGPQTFSAENVSVNVTSPTDVEIGEEFTTPYSIDPVSVEVPSLPLGARLETASRLKLDFALPEDTGRMKYDIRLPQGVAISNLRISGAGVGFNNNPVVQRVNSSGAPDANGEFARIWDGGNSVNNGGNENDNWQPWISRAGLQVDRHKT